MAAEGWENIEKKALWALEHAAELSPREPVKGTAPLLRVWEYCPKGTYTSWTVLSSAGTNDVGRPTVREVVWKRDQDKKHLASVSRKNKLRAKPQSAVRVRDAQILAQDLRPYIEAAGHLAGSPEARQDPDSRETSYGIEGFRSFAYLRMEWWGSGPVEWVGTIRWVTRLRKLLAASLKEREEADD